MSENRLNPRGSIGAFAAAVALGVLVLLAAVLPWGDRATAEVRNSKHDFSSGGTGGIWGSEDIDQVCVFCHTPHNANLTAPAPLWNREVGNTVFNLYESGTLNASVQQPGPTTLACLGCHDGSVAIDMIAHGNPGGPSMMAIGDVYYPGSPYGQGGANIGGNYAGNSNVNALGDDHPVSFVYDSALATADGGLKDPSALTSDLPLYNSRLECATCHDVHNSRPGIPSLLRVTSAGGALCLSCHKK
jgi:predicted CXXCH cytochrome family protein